MLQDLMEAFSAPTFRGVRGEAGGLVLASANQALAAFLRRPIRSLGGQRLSELLPPLAERAADLLLQPGHGPVRTCQGLELLSGATVDLLLQLVRRDDGGLEVLGTLFDASMRDVADEVEARRQAELERSRARTALALAAAEAGTWDWDLASGRVACSELTCRLFGLPPDAAEVGIAAFDRCILPADLEAVPAAVQRALETGAPYRAEFRVAAADGGVRWLESRGEVRRDPAGQPLEIIGVTLDVTTRKAAEQALGQSRERLLQALAAGGQVAWETDLATLTYRIEAGAPTWLGWPIEALPRTREALTALIHPEDRARLSEDDGRLTRGEVPGEMVEYRLRAANGAYRWVQSNVAVIERDAQGRPLRLIATTTDIDARRRAELALEATSRRLTLALKAGGTAVWETDFVAGTITVDSTASRPLGLGDGPRTFTLSEHARYFHPDDRAHVAQAMARVRAGEQDAIEYESRMVRADGKVFWVHRRGEVVEWDAAGRPARVLGVSVDITARKAAEAAARARQAELEALYDQSPLGLALLDRELRFVRVNPSLAATNGRSVEEHLGNGVWDIVPELRPLVEPAFQHVLATGERIAEIEVVGEVPSAPGMRREWIQQLYPVKDEAGRVVAVGAIVEEVTERRRIARALAQSEARFRLIAAAVPQAFWLEELTPERRLAYVSPPWERICGRPIPDYLADADFWLEHVHRDDRAQVASTYQAWLAGDRGERWRAEYRLVRPDGGLRWVLEEGRLIRDAAGRPFQVVGTSTDVTERKAAEAALRASEQRLRLALEAGRLSVWERDFATGRLVLETRFLPWLGLGDGPVTLDEAEFLARYVHPDDADGVRARAARIAADPTARPRGLVRLRRTDGGHGWVAVENVAQRAEGTGRPVGSIAVAADVTAAKEAELALQRARAEVEAALAAERNANLMLRSFVAMASHEIRTPLATIATAAEHVAEEAGAAADAELAACAQRIQNAVARLLRLVQRLLDGERASGGRAVFRPRPTDPAELLRGCVANARLDHPIREVRAEGSWPALPLLPLDRGLLEVALHTLIGNAVKFSRRHTPVTVALEADANRVRFVVRDQGIGIPAAELAQVGTRFFRASNAAGRPGSGLGLALAREVAALHGGEVRLDSREGQGTTAALCLPRAPAAEWPR